MPRRGKESTITSSSGVTTSNNSLAKIETTPDAPVAQVGSILYLWYSNNGSGWNGSTYSPGGGAVVDRPLAGDYTSDSNSTFATQISQMQSAGLTFAIVSWWGPSTSGENGSINRATHDLFKFLKMTNSSFKIGIMVDAYEGRNNLDYTQLHSIYNYVETEFVIPYSNWYFNWQDKPLLLFFNPIFPVYDNSSYTVRTIGNSPNPVNWTFWDAPATYYDGEGGNGINYLNDLGPPVISSDGEVTIVPRIDSFYDYTGHFQQGYLRFDWNLSQGLYSYEWQYVISHSSSVKLVLVYSWNEYHERTEIEPHYDPTTNLTKSGPYYLLDVTSGYVSQLEERDGGPHQTAAMNFSFNASLALNFYKESRTPLGLVALYPGSNTIYLSDDQALDYYALLDIYNSTGNPIATELASEINSTMNSHWGGLFKYWNPVFYILQNRSFWMDENGVNNLLSTVQDPNGTSYFVNTTVFSPDPNFNFSSYADLELYYCIWNLHVGNYSAAESTFHLANSYWDGYGFNDGAFSKGEYTSYKLAVDLIAWKMLESNQSTRTFADEYLNQIHDVTSIMSKLQSSNGGVWTNYFMQPDGSISFGPGITQNGETTSLFAIASR